MNQYVIFDLETSCLSSKCAEIIDIAAIKISNNEIVDTFNSLIKPENGISESATEVNGITMDTVENAPSASEVLSAFVDFIGNLTLVGHNIASYDLPIVKRCVSELFDIDLKNEYIDTLYVAKKRIDNIPNYRLGTIASYFGIDTDDAHRALPDCIITKLCYEKLLEMPICEDIKSVSSHKRKITFTEETKALQELQGFLLGITADNILVESEVLSLKSWLDKHSDLSGNYPFDRVFSAIEKALEDDYLSAEELDDLLVLFKDFSSPVESCSCKTINFDFSEKTICLSGDFEYGAKKEIEDIFIKSGAICRSSVSKKTDYVVVGSCGSSNWSCGNYGSKIKKALELQSQGCEIKIIKEEELTDFFKKR